MRHVALSVVLAGLASSCSLFGSATPSTTTTSTTSVTATPTSADTTTTSTIPAAAHVEDLPDIDQYSPASSIRVAQRLATARGLSTVVDGGFGEQTRARVNALREILGLEPTGVVDANVWRAVFDESTLPFGPVNPDVLGGVTAREGLQVPEIAFLFAEEVTEVTATAHFLIPFFVDGKAFADWARREATAALGNDWMVCDTLAGSGDDLVILTGVSSQGLAFDYRVVAMGRGRVDIRIDLSSVAVGQCP
jgi:peptidoglycan hydrolase-like protein with peptidoglycan-binding domain